MLEAFKTGSSPYDQQTVMGDAGTLDAEAAMIETSTPAAPSAGGLY